MRLYNVTVIRKQVWEYKNIQAKSKNEAMAKAEQMACDDTPDNDYAYDTIVQEVEE